VQLARHPVIASKPLISGELKCLVRHGPSPCGPYHAALWWDAPRRHRRNGV